MAWLRPRLRIVGGAATVGVLAGGVSVILLLLLLGDPMEVTEVVFSIAALIFGFASIGWSGSILAGKGFENLQKHLSTGSQWTERDSRRAMSRIGGFGAGGMFVVTVLTTFLV